MDSLWCAWRTGVWPWVRPRQVLYWAVVNPERPTPEWACFTTDEESHHGYEESCEEKARRQEGCEEGR
jgi:hypothetical protein